MTDPAFGAVEFPHGAPAPHEAAGPDDEISVLDLLIVLAKHKWLMAGLPLFAGILAAVVSMNMTEIYTGSAKLLPPQQPQSTAGALLSQIGSLGSLATGALGMKSASDTYVGMLKSRTLADALVDRFKLMEAYGAERRSDARAMLGGASQITVGKDGLISVEVNDPDPKRAAALANGYVEELEKLSGVLAVTEAGQRRLFFERQLGQAKENLLKAEMAARSALEQGGLAAVDAQGRSLLQMSAMLRARVSAKEVELNSMRGFATEQNPQFNKVQQELVALRAELAKLEGGGEATAGARGGRDKGIRNVSLLREVRYQEVLFELLARQYELAKVDEAREGAVIQLLDKAIEPDRRSSPKRSLIVLTSMAVAVFVAAILAFLFEWVERARRSPEDSRRLAQLSRYAALRR
jgi:tyrosine-protein kinase Etk/Wzc